MNTQFLGKTNCTLVVLQLVHVLKRRGIWPLYLMLCGVRKMNCLLRWLAATFSIMSIDIRRFTMSWSDGETLIVLILCHSSQSTWFIQQSGSSYHENIKLVEAAEGRLCDGPERENEANGGERALATGQRAHVTQVGFVSLTRLHLQGRGRVRTPVVSPPCGISGS